MAIRIVRLGTLRRPPRGVKKDDYGRARLLDVFREDYGRCHRSILEKLLVEHGAEVAKRAT